MCTLKSLVCSFLWQSLRSNRLLGGRTLLGSSYHSTRYSRAWAQAYCLEVPQADLREVPVDSISIGWCPMPVSLLVLYVQFQHVLS